MITELLKSNNLEDIILGVRLLEKEDFHIFDILHNRDSHVPYRMYLEKHDNPQIVIFTNIATYLIFGKVLGPLAKWQNLERLSHFNIKYDFREST